MQENNTNLEWINNSTYLINNTEAIYNLSKINNEVSITIGNNNVTLLLHENPIMVNEINITTFYGKVKNHPNSNVRLTIGKTFLMGTIRINNIEYAINPSRLINNQSKSNNSVFFKVTNNYTSNLIPNSIVTQISNISSNKSISKKSTSSLSTNTVLKAASSDNYLTEGNKIYHLLRLGVFCDSGWTNAGFPEQFWTWAIAAIFNIVEDIYMNQFDLKFRIFSQLLSKVDGWNENGMDLVEKFGDYLESKNYMCTSSSSTLGNLNRLDKAILLTTKNLGYLGNDLYGLADDMPGRYAVVEGDPEIDELGYETTYGGPNFWTGDLPICISHEMGHLFDASHGPADPPNIQTGDPASIMYGAMLDAGTYGLVPYFVTQNELYIRNQLIQLEWYVELYPGGDVHTDGIRLDVFYSCYRRIHQTNKDTYHYYRITNTNANSVILNMVFFGCLNELNYPNMDFGHTVSDYTLYPGYSRAKESYHKFSSTGAYQVWPAYRINSASWGMYKWKHSSIPIVNEPIATFGGPVVADEDGNVEMYNFNIYSACASQTNPTINSILVIDYYFENENYDSNTQMGTSITFSPYGIFVGCRDPSNNNRDFGHNQIILDPYPKSYNEKYNNNDRTRLTVWMNPYLAGNWNFWPAYWYDLGNGDSGWGITPWNSHVINVV